MTIKEIKEMYKGQYQELEIYSPLSVGEHYPNHFHTDNCESVQDYPDDVLDELEVGLHDLMDETDYNNSICANSSIQADFTEWYDDKNAKILCIMLAHIL